MTGLLKLSVGRLASAIAALAVIVGGISWWQMEPATRALIIDTVGRCVGWMLAVVAIPWVSFPLITWVAKKDSNAAGVMLVGAITLLEAVALFWLFGFSLPGAAAWALAIAAILLAAVYNVLACDWIAEKFE